MARRIFHWKHGWIPLDDYARSIKASKTSAAAYHARVSKAAPDLISRLHTDGGFTYDPKTGKVLEIGKTSGYAVAVPGTEHVVGIESPDKSEYVTREEFAKGVAQVIMKNKARFARGAKIGGWYSPERNAFMVEVTDIVPANRREAAIQAGKDRNQEAIFDLATGETINTGGTGDAPADPVLALSKFDGDLSSEERSAVKFYTGPGFRPLNNNLRQNRPLGAPLSVYEKRLDAALAKSVVPQDTTVHRGVVGGAWLPTNLAPGTILQDPGYVSTAADPKSTYTGDTRMVIKVPRGTHALDLTGYKLSHHAEEAELLLPRGTPLRVISDGQVNGMRVLNLEVATGG